VWLGDLDYENSPAFWQLQMDVALGAEYPYLVTIGNHDTYAWDGYATIIEERLATMPEADCKGETGVNQSCEFNGLRLLLSGVGTYGEDHEDFLEDELVADDHIWRVCAWHKNQNDMQIGAKGDEVGWDAFRICQDGAAMIAMGHEHSYARTVTLSDIGDRVNNHGASGPYDELSVSHGSTFAVVAGTAGQAYRSYEPGYHDDDTWWASYYTSDRYMNDGVVEKLTEPAVHGALFVTFHVNGDPRRAHAEFKTYEGTILDEFEIYAP
jgi:hypothetical protein